MSLSTLNFNLFCGSIKDTGFPFITFPENEIKSNIKNSCPSSVTKVYIISYKKKFS